MEPDGEAARPPLPSPGEAEGAAGPRPTPSAVERVGWLHARRREGTYPEPTARNGKWLVFVARDRVDALWDPIAEAVRAGRLGSRAKVSTARPSPRATSPDEHVICVYTYDWQDRADVGRVREELRRLGVTWEISYKTDEDTRRGRYRVTGYRNLSKYRE